MNGTATAHRTDTIRIPIIAAEPDTTVEFFPPWLRPPVTSRHITPRGRLAHRWQLVRASRFAVDVRAGVRRGLAVMGAFAVVIAFVVLVHGAYVAAELVGVVR